MTHTHTPPILIMKEQCSHFLTALFVLSYHLCSGYCLLLKTFLCLMVNICDVNFIIFVHVCSQTELIQRLEEEVSRLKSQHSSVCQQVSVFTTPHSYFCLLACPTPPSVTMSTYCNCHISTIILKGNQRLYGINSSRMVLAMPSSSYLVSRQVS